LSVIGVGTDIVDIARMTALLERHGERFLRRCFSAAERADIGARDGASRSATLAGRWAAKEAFLKGLGGQISNVPYSDINIVRCEGGAPALTTRGVAAAVMADRGGLTVHLSISHERAYAVAMIVIES